MYRMGDYVIRKSYGGDMIFRISRIYPHSLVKLKGVSYRILADAPMRDLEPVNMMRLQQTQDSSLVKAEMNIKKILKDREQKVKQKGNILSKSGRVLHIDGDPFYLQLCLKYYEMLGVKAVAEYITEIEQPQKIRMLLEKHMPDMLVITGHDAMNKNTTNRLDLNQYRSSKYFVETVKQARRFLPSFDSLVIFAGACQSDYDALIEAGANFASSPDRVMIHALDPVFMMERIAYGSINDVIDIHDVVEYTISGFEALGGFQTRGKYREGAPAISFKEHVDTDIYI